MTARRELQLAVALCLVGSALVLLAVARTWVTISGLDGGLTIDGSTSAVTGTDLVPGVRALAVVGLAGVVALAATRRFGRVLVGVLLVAAGLGIVAGVARVLPDLEGRASRASQTAGAGVSGQSPTYGTSGWPWVALTGGGVLAVSGGLVAVRGRRWAGLSASYDAPTPAGSAAAADAPPTDKAAWDALDRGEDPTA